MKILNTIKSLLALTVVALLAAGCASANLNPPRARANTGYVDLYAPSAGDLWWEVARFDDRTRNFAVVYSEFNPPKGGVVRLALAPGHNRMRVTFLNRDIVQPAEIEVDVQDGRISPVRVVLTEGGASLVQTKSMGWAGYRRHKVATHESVTYEISAVVAPSVPYEIKEKLSYDR